MLQYIPIYKKWFILLICVCCFLSSKEQNIAELELKLKSTKNLDSIAKVQSDLGRLFFTEGNFVKAQEFFFKSMQNAEKAGNKHIVTVAYNNIAATYQETENYPQAIVYATKAIEGNKVLHDTIGLANSYNTLATIYYMEEKDSLSLHYSNLSLSQRLLTKDSIGIFAGYKNLGAILFEMKDTAQGIFYIEKSLRYINNNDSLKWFSGYLTLGGAYFYSGNLTKAKKYLDSSTAYLPHAKAFDRLEDYYYTLFQYYKKTGNFKQAISNFELYGIYRDSTVNIKKNEQLTELNIKYETEKKENIIAQQKYEIAQKKIWLWVALIGFALLCIVAYFMYKNFAYKQQKKQAQLIFQQQQVAAKSLFDGEQNERIRIARDLHDGLGQMLSLVKMNLSTLDANNKTVQKTIAIADKTIEEVRNISHNLIPEELNFGIFRAIENLAEKINASGNTKMDVDVSEQIQALQFEKQNELSIYRIVQEVINNMIKHAHASLINLSIYRVDNQIIITIRDNGRGLNAADINQSKGIGWKNINARVRLLDGKINVQSEKLSGTQIEITLPANGTK